MNPDGYIGGLTLQGFVYLDDAEANSFLDDDTKVGNVTYDNSSDIALVAKLPFHQQFTITVYFNYRAYDGIFQPNSLGQRIGYERNKNAFSNTTFGAGVTVYFKKLF